MNSWDGDMACAKTAVWSQAMGEFAGLPVYRREFAGRDLWYTPGLLALLPKDAEDRLIREATDLLRGAAEHALRQWEEIFTVPYTPLALTLYLHNDCQLRCTYCFTTGKDRPEARLAPGQVRAAARRVARNCRQAGRPFQTIFHGGGEPTRRRGQVDAILDALQDIANEEGVPLSSYIATNGVLSAQKAAWLAQRFDLIGLSCDGSEAVHAAQRPTRSGASSLPFVERSARILHEMDRPFHVRVTVTPAALPLLEESVAYICRVLRPAEIHIEPVYASSAAPLAAFAPEQAADVLAAYRQARQVAGAYGIPVETSGSRLAAVHGPYCNALRPVLNMLPDGSATACFKLTQSAPADPRWLGPGSQGAPDPMDIEQRVGVLRQALRANLEACRPCFNALHCARDCPDACLVERPAVAESFRCAFNRALADSALLDAARRGIESGQIFMRELVIR